MQDIMLTLQMKRHIAIIVLKFNHSDTERERESTFWKLPDSLWSSFRNSWKLMMRIQHQRLNAKCTRWVLMQSEHVTLSEKSQK